MNKQEATRKLLERFRFWGRKPAPAGTQERIDADTEQNTVNEYDQTPMQASAEEGNKSEILRLLINNGSKVNALDNHDNTPLHLAAFTGHDEAITLLIKAGAELDVVNKNGDTPLDLAERQGHSEAARLLIEAGAKHL